MYRSQTSRTAVALSKVGGQVLVALVMVTVLAVTASAQQCSDTQFVERVFGDFLFRAPDGAAVSFYTPLVASVGRQAVAASITGSQEYAVDLVGGNPTVVAGLYQKYLGRNPNSGDVTFWVGKEPMKDSGIIATLMGSTEYRIRAMGLNPAIAATNSKIANQMFLDLLGRNATSGELTFYGGQLGTQSAATVATNIMATDEYFTRMIQQAFQRMLHRAPTATDMSFYLAAVKTAPRPDEDLLNALAGSAEYCNGTAQSPTFGFVAPSDVLPALNSPVVPSNVDQLPAVQQGPVEVAGNTAVLTLGAEAAAAAGTIASLQNEVTTLQQQVATDAATINSLQSQLAAAQTQAAADASTISSLQAQVASLQQQLTDANNALAPLQAQVTSLQQQLATANNTINALQSQVNTLQQQLATANNTIATLQGQASSDAATIAALQAQVSSLTFQLSTVGSTIAAQEQTILDIAGVLVGQAPSKAAAMAAGSVAQAKVTQATGNPALVRQAQSALAKGNAEVVSGDYAGAVRDFRLAYLLAGNASK